MGGADVGRRALGAVGGSNIWVGADPVAYDLDEFFNTLSSCHLYSCS